jgi:hypothetical protein
VGSDYGLGNSPVAEPESLPSDTILSQFYPSLSFHPLVASALPSNQDKKHQESFLRK